MTLADGRIAQCGTHEELLQTGGVYKQLFETQFAKVLEEMERQTSHVEPT